MDSLPGRIPATLRFFGLEWKRKADPQPRQQASRAARKRKEALPMVVDNEYMLMLKKPSFVP
jgi:hypothetical protein